MVLTLVILLLMSLMGMAIMANTRTEMTVAANTIGGRDAFTRADTASRVATLLSRLLVHEYELGSPKQVLTGGPLSVSYDESRFNMTTMLAEADNFDYARRYMGAAGRTDAPDADLRPHIIFRQDGKVVSTAFVTLDYGEALIAGGSLGDSGYDASGGRSVRIVLAVTVNARPPVSDDDNYGAYDSAASGSPGDAKLNDVPHSVITTLFRETF